MRALACKIAVFASFPVACEKTRFVQTMTDMLLNRREQRPVGQGFFHWGSVRAAIGEAEPWPLTWPMLPGDLFYVYDCGAMQRYVASRNREVHDLRQHSMGKTLDFLFLSHLHADHVNGIPALLIRRGGLSVDTIVMPLIDDVERLVTFAGSLEAGSARSGDAFYRDLVVDPVAALARFSPRQILLVRRARPDSDEGAPDPAEPVAPDGGDLPSDGRGELGDDQSLRWKLVGRGRVGVRAVRDNGDSREDPDGPTVFEIVDSVAVRASAQTGPAWLLAPYVDPAFRKRAAFIRALAAELGLTVGRLRALVSDYSTRRTLIMTKASELRRAYKTISSDLNLTSMSLLSGPADALQLHTVRWITDWNFAPSWYFHQNSNGRAAWLGTGDADLKNSRRRRALLGHYRRYLEQVLTLCVPHHGSERNFHAELLLRVEPRLCVAAADAYRKWRHPATNVMQAIASAGIPFRLVTSSSTTALREHIACW